MRPLSRPSLSLSSLSSLFVYVRSGISSGGFHLAKIAPLAPVALLEYLHVHCDGRGYLVSNHL
jgi:hypothetical protein